jgi:hypothetical protein
MPIDYVIDLEHRLVRARVSGVMSDDDVFTYQSTVWSRPVAFLLLETLDRLGVRDLLDRLLAGK